MFGIVICIKNLVNSCREMWKQIEKNMVIDHFIVKIQVILNSSNIDEAPAVTEPLRLLWHSCSFQVSQSKRLKRVQQRNTRH